MNHSEEAKQHKEILKLQQEEYKNLLRKEAETRYESDLIGCISDINFAKEKKSDFVEIFNLHQYNLQKIQSFLRNKGLWVEVRFSPNHSNFNIINEEYYLQIKNILSLAEKLSL